MGRMLEQLQRFFRELKRRNVYRVAATYAVVGFVLIQAADLLFPALRIPSWAYSLVVVLILFGFPIALVVAWAFEVTPEGVRRAKRAEPGEGELGETEAGTRIGYQLLIGLGLVAAAVAGGWYLTGGGEPGEPDTDVGRSIAVLPFDNLSGTEEAEPFVNGIHDDLLTRLSNISDLKVISRTSVLAYRETELSMPAIADSLGVAWIVEGGVQQVGDQVQVTAQLIRAREDAQQWAESYRRDLNTENLFAIQGELTKRIARSLETQLSPEETERVERRPTDNLDAYRLYARGRRQLEGRTEEGMWEAVALFRQSIEEDSTYALAWAGLADAFTHLGGYGHAGEETVFPLAWDAARRALELDPDLAEAHASLGNLHIWEYEGPTALRELVRAIALQPSLAHAHDQLGFLLLILGREERALEHASLARVLNPMSPSPPALLAGVYLAMGEYGKTLEYARRAQEIQPNYPIARMLEFAALYRQERWEEARTVAGREMPDSEEVHRFYRRVDLALLDVAEGELERARQRLQWLIDRDAIPYGRGLIHAALGDEDAALDAFDEMVETAGPWETINLRYFRSDVLGPLRQDPRYASLLRRLNRAWGLNADGSLPDSVKVSFGSETYD